MKKIDSLRDCLLKNKIFFEIFSYLLVGVISVYLSVVANEYLFIQTSLLQQDRLPIFRVENYLIENNNKVLDSKEIISIFNDGYPVNIFSCEQYCFLNVIINFGEYPSPNKYKLIIPIEKYFELKRYIDSTKKIIEGNSIITVNDIYKAGDENSNDLIEDGTSRDVWIETFYLTRYISLKYEDRLGHETTVYYELSSNLITDDSRPEKISNQKADEIVKLHDSLSRESVDINTSEKITFETIKKKVNKIINDQQLIKRFTGRS